MVVEAAQRIIALSLGKIATSRAQRGGARLHRSLLVAGVLMHARSATVQSQNDCTTDLEEQKYLTDCAPFSDSVVHPVDESDPETFLELEADQSVPGAEPCLTTNTGTTDLPGVEDHSLHTLQPVDIQPLSALPDSTVPSKDSRLFDSAAHKTDFRPSSSEDILPDVIPNSDRKTRGVKRRSESWDSEKMDYRKRSKYETKFDMDEGNVEVVEADSSTDDEDDERMQIDCLQLTSLVHSFNSGFSGLLSASSEPFLTYVERGDSFYGSGDAVKLNSATSTSESMISCSLHIREALETLSRPVVAMSG